MTREEFKDKLRRAMKFTILDLKQLEERYQVPFEDAEGCIEHIYQLASEWIDEVEL